MPDDSDIDVDGDNVVDSEAPASEVTADAVVDDSDSNVPADVVSDVSANGNDDDVVSEDLDDVDAEELAYSVDAVDSVLDPVDAEVSDPVEVDADESILEAKSVLGEDFVPVNDSIRSHS